MQEHPENKSTTDLASRIEQTLTEREQERLRRAPEEIEISDTGHPRGRGVGFHFLMLSLGIIVGVAIGVALYFVFPFPESVPTIDLPQLEGATALEEADRLFVAGQGAAAKKAYLAVISEKQNSPRPYNNLATLYAAEGDLDQAQELLNKALSTDPDYFTIYKNIGRVYAAMARDSYGKALQIEGDSKPLRLQTLGFHFAAPALAQEVTSQGIDREPVVANTESSAPMTIARIEEVPTVSKLIEIQSPAESSADKLSLPESGTLTGSVSIVASEEIAPLGLEVPSAENNISPQQFLQQWALAWSSQQVDSYLGSYAPDFVLSGKRSYQSWKESRRARLMAPSFIQVNLDTIELKEEREGLVTAQAIQSYTSDRYQDRTRKSFVLRRKGDSWEILEEKSLGRVR